MKSPTKAEINTFFKTDRAILMICMGVALVFWLLVKLSKDYKTTSNFEISYILPDGKTFTESPPKTVKATLDGKGWDLISNRFKSESTLVVFELSESRTQNIGSNQIVDKIKQLVALDIKVSDVNVNFIDIEMQDQAEKKVPVILESELTFAPLVHLMDSIALFPDSVRITGPYSIVETIENWPTEILKLKDIKSSSLTKVALQTPVNHQLRLNPPNVSVDLQVEEFTEESLFVPIRIKNGPDSLKLFPEKLRLTYIAGLSRIQEINSDSFTVEVDLAGIPLKTEKNTVPVYISHQPDFVKSVKMSPQSVEFFFVEAQDGKGSPSKKNK